MHATSIFTSTKRAESGKSSSGCFLRHSDNFICTFAEQREADAQFHNKLKMMFKCVKGYFYNSPLLDNFIFKLCYRWTVLLLVTFSFIVTCRLLLGDSFTCTSNSDISSKYMNVKCYADGTYTILSKLVIDEDGSAPVEPSAENYRRYHTYYPWTNLLFLIHAFNFYLPHLLWKSYEGGYMSKLTAGIRHFFDKEERRGLELCYLAKHLIVTQGKHNIYTCLYITFEVSNYAIALAQTLWLVYFFDVTGVPDFLSFALKTWSDFRQFYFPPSGLCEIKKVSSMGEHTRIVAMCEMPLNRLYMLMFLFLHAWYIVVTILTGFVLAYRLALLLPTFRVFSANRSAPLAEKSVLKSLCYRMSYSDWFFLTRLQKMMTDVDFSQMLDKLAIVSQGGDPQKDYDKSSLYEENMKDLDDSVVTSPL